ncbi:hypothetical protein PQ478_07150 [Alkalihalophilus pseudofirmus]|uniref:hypothetical protein n=1 Tax=Alkalihalophilus pseudofirmus TaxID=79885 RepID=UPI00259B4A99|nr:hypothetical protein [Alkalihalophilus pseudofirmus]WEG18250.1 hypothetical protein PQ478_07150 [Alkalihalophilus pseudofirmus]
MKRILIICIFLLIASGCGQRAQTIKPLQVGEEAIVSQHEADESKQILLSMEEILEVVGVSTEKDIYLAPRVKQLDRFHLNDIRERGHENVKKRFPEYTVHVSTDKKIFIELGKLEKELKQRTISKKRYDAKLKDLEEKMKG